MGMRQRGDYNIRIAVFYEYSYVLESRVASFEVQHTGTCYTVEGQTRLQNERYARTGGARKTRCEQ